MIYRGTTPTIRLRITNAEYDISQLNPCEIMMVNDSGRNLKIFSDCVKDNENKIISVRLSHDDTLDFEEGTLLVQLWAVLNGEEMCSPVLTTQVGKNLKHMN